jgi:hypothetical protein
MHGIDRIAELKVEDYAARRAQRGARTGDCLLGSRSVVLAGDRPATDRALAMPALRPDETAIPVVLGYMATYFSGPN